MTREQIIKQVAQEVREFGYFDNSYDIVQEVLDAANYFELREAAQNFCRCFNDKRANLRTDEIQAYDRLLAILSKRA